MLSAARLWSGQLTDGPHIKLTLSTECTVRGSRTFFWLLRSHSYILNMPEIPLPPSPPLMNTEVWALEPGEGTEKNHTWSWVPGHLSLSLFSSTWLFLREKGREAGRQTSLIAKLCWGTGVCTVLVRRARQSLCDSPGFSPAPWNRSSSGEKEAQAWRGQSLVQRHPGSDW